jgi:hypothetical protein
MWFFSNNCGSDFIPLGVVLPIVVLPIVAVVKAVLISVVMLSVILTSVALKHAEAPKFYLF